MKVIIQIPCLNEAESLPIALRELPRSLPGIACVEWLVIDDGSTDATVDVARAHGVHHIVRHPSNRGLAEAFMSGVKECLRQGADIIVNTDADNQYCADDIPKLIEPIVSGRCEFVIGARPISSIEHFSFIKKRLQKLGSAMVRLCSGTKVSDAPSGFRAMSARVAMSLFIHNRYTYTLDSIIQAGSRNIKIESVPIRVNGDLRPSRLVKSIFSYVRKSIGTMLFCSVIYRPFGFFLSLSFLSFIPGLVLGIRFLVEYWLGNGQGRIQSLILVAVLILISALFGCLAILSELMSINRRILEDIRAQLMMNSSQKK